MTSEEVRETVLSLEAVTAALLGEKADGRKFDEAMLAEAIRQGPSQLLAMSLVAALIHDYASYKLVLRENTRNHPGGSPRLGLWRDKMHKAHEVASFIRAEEERHGKREAAVSEARMKFNIGRSTVFEYLALSDFLDGIE